MRNKRTILMALFAMVLSVFMVTATLSAAEKKFVKLVDNFIILFDSSASMEGPYKNTKMRKIEAEKKAYEEYSKYQSKTLSSVDQAYLENMKQLEKKVEKKIKN